MADTATEKSQTSKPTSGKVTPQAGALVTPEATPAVEDARAEADKARRAAEVPDEIKRILSSDTDFSLLGVDQDSSEEVRVAAWQNFGCKIHPKYCGYDNRDENKTAYKKLKEAARHLGVEDRFIVEVKNWDGVTDLQADGDESDVDMDGQQPEEANLPEPPERVCEIYKKATPSVHKLSEDPDDRHAHNELLKLNLEILKGNNDHNKLYENDESKKILSRQWEIPMAFFQNHYTTIAKSLHIVKTEPSNNRAREVVEKELSLIKAFVEKRHFPSNWCPPVTLPSKNHIQAVPPTENATPPVNSVVIKYPWPTHQTTDGLIVGVRQRGVGGPQVCVETTTTDGRIVRRLESATDFGLAQVKHYMSIPNYKSLSNADSKWSRKDEADFKKLHWVTMSRIKNKNTATGKKDPPTDCCVEFKSKGYQMLTVSNVCNVLGRKLGRAAIEEVCERDGIPAPWNREPMNTFHKVPKDGPKKSAAERWAMVDSTEQQPFATTSSNSAPVSTKGDFKDARVDLLNDKIDDLEKKIDLLMATIGRVLEGGNPEQSLFVQQPTPPSS